MCKRNDYCKHKLHPQEDAATLNRCYSALLVACFASSAGTAAQDYAASLAAAPPDLALCARVWEGWQHQLQAAKARPQPATAEAAEAAAVMVLLGQRQYMAGGWGPGWWVGQLMRQQGAV